MFTIPVTRESCPVAVLLGGSGHSRLATRTNAVPALLKPLPAVLEPSGDASKPHAVGV